MAGINMNTTEAPEVTEDKTSCKCCGSKNLHDLGHGYGDRDTVICLDCKAKWCGIWRTKEDWFNWINEGYKS
jgi:hypothetical protein